MQLDDVLALLKLASPIDALIGPRVYPLLLPEKSKLPAIVGTTLKRTPQNALDGFAGLDLQDVLIEILAETYLDAKRVRDAARLALQASPALLTCSDETEVYDETVRVYRVTQTWVVWN